MKKVLIILLIAIIFLAGCKSKPEATGNSVSITIPATSTAESSIPAEETTIFSTSPETCPKQFLRKQINADGSIQEYCLQPEYFKLKPCQTYKDCTAAEDCVNGYCYIVDEDVTS